MREMLFAYCLKCGADYLINPTKICFEDMNDCNECGGTKFKEGTAKEVLAYRRSINPMPIYIHQDNNHLDPTFQL